MSTGAVVGWVAAEQVGFASSAPPIPNAVFRLLATEGLNRDAPAERERSKCKRSGASQARAYPSLVEAVCSSARRQRQTW